MATSKKKGGYVEPAGFFSSETMKKYYPKGFSYDYSKDTKSGTKKSTSKKSK